MTVYSMQTRLPTSRERHVAKIMFQVHSYRKPEAGLIKRVLNAAISLDLDTSDIEHQAGRGICEYIPTGSKRRRFWIEYLAQQFPRYFDTSDLEHQ